VQADKKKERAISKKYTYWFLEKCSKTRKNRPPGANPKKPGTQNHPREHFYPENQTEIRFA